MFKQRSARLFTLYSSLSAAQTTGIPGQALLGPVSSLYWETVTLNPCFWMGLFSKVSLETWNKATYT